MPLCEAAAQMWRALVQDGQQARQEFVGQNQRRGW